MDRGRKVPPLDTRKRLKQIRILSRLICSKCFSKRVGCQLSVTLVLPQLTPLIGYTEICGFRFMDSTQIPLGPITGADSPFVVRVTSGPPSFNPISGYQINQHQKFIEFYDDYVSLDSNDDMLSDSGTLDRKKDDCRSFEVYKASRRREGVIAIQDK
jgi:hypothetical protein